MIPPLLTQAQQVTTAESSRTTVRPPGASLLTWLTFRVLAWLRIIDLLFCVRIRRNLNT